MGHYKEPSWGIDKIVDNGMFEGIRNFQKEKGLKVDGIMKPQGETEGRINEVIKNNSIYQYGYNLGKKTDDWKNEAQKVAKYNISDENKHQYMSCLAGKEGVGMAGIGLLGGIYKEGRDLQRKLTNPIEIQRYQGKLGVISDSGKDMKNNIKGLGYGLFNQNPNCNGLLKKKI